MNDDVLRYLDKPHEYEEERNDVAILLDKSHGKLNFL